MGTAEAGRDAAPIFVSSIFVGGTVPHSAPLAAQGQTSWLQPFALGDALLHVSRWLDREYLFETLDHLSGPAAQSATYPRLSFGPGQRYTSKGVYSVPSVVPLGEPRWIVT